MLRGGGGLGGNQGFLSQQPPFGVARGLASRKQPHGLLLLLSRTAVILVESLLSLCRPRRFRGRRGIGGAEPSDGGVWLLTKHKDVARCSRGSLVRST